MNLLLIDNSNIFIEVKNLGSGARFDYDRFVKKHINTRNLRKILVGSTPPKSDKFWSTMKSKGFEVFTYERTKSGEKRVDTRIVAEGVEFITEQAESATLIIMSGDLDMGTLIEKACKKKWEIILWSWNNSLNNEYIDGELSECVTVRYLDEVKEELIFFDEEFEGVYQREYLKDRLIRLKKEEFKNKVQKAKCTINRLEYIDKNIYLEAIDKLTEVEQIIEIDNILSEAQDENNRLKAERKEQEGSGVEKFIENNLGWLASGALVVVGGIVYTIKKLSK